MQVYVQDGSLFVEVPGGPETPTSQIRDQADLLTSLLPVLLSELTLTEAERRTLNKVTYVQLNVDGETKFVRKITCPDILEALVILNRLVEEEGMTLRTIYPSERSPKRSRGASNANLANTPQGPLDHAGGMLTTQGQRNLFASGLVETKVFVPGEADDEVLSLRKTVSAGWFRRIFERDDIFARVQRGAQSDDNGARAQRGAQANHKRFEATHKAALPTQATKEGLLRFLEACPNLENLTLSGCTAVDDEVVNAIARRNLHTLDLTNCERITDIGVKRLARCTRLTYLCLGGCNVTDDGIRPLVAGFSQGFSGCKKLEHLDLGSVRISDTTLRALGQHCPHLSLLRLNDFLLDSNSVSDAGVVALTRGCTQLSTFSLNCQRLTDAGYSALGTVPLRKLELSHCPQLTNIRDLAQPHLEQLSLYKCPNLIHVSALRRSTQLTSLSLTQCPRMLDAGIGVLGSECPRLQTLYLRRCTLVNRGIRAVAQGCVDLRLLSVDDCAVGDEEVHALRQCHRLHSLHMANCNITNAAAVSIAQMRRLRRLDISGTHMTDAGVITVVQQRRKLRILDAGHTAVTDAGWEAIGQHCRKLEMLVLSGTQVTNGGLVAFASVVRPKFRSLFLYDCAHITEAAVDQVRGMRPGWSISSSIDSSSESDDEI
jgi:Leucine-rich repeat (LRR) protein